MRSLKTVLIIIGLLGLGACGTQPQNTNSPPPRDSSDPQTTEESHGGKGGQVIETGEYHLELLTLKEPGGIHLDFYLQKGDSHEPVPNATVTAQVQLPDGTQQTLNFQYKTQDQHYTAILPSTTPGEYSLAVLTDINGQKVNGRFTFEQ